MNEQAAMLAKFNGCYLDRSRNRECFLEDGRVVFWVDAGLPAEARRYAWREFWGQWLHVRLGAPWKGRDADLSKVTPEGVVRLLRVLSRHKGPPLSEREA